MHDWTEAARARAEEAYCDHFLEASGVQRIKSLGVSFLFSNWHGEGTLADRLSIQSAFRAHLRKMGIDELGYAEFPERAEAFKTADFSYVLAIRANAAVADEVELIFHRVMSDSEASQ